MTTVALPSGAVGTSLPRYPTHEADQGGVAVRVPVPRPLGDALHACAGQLGVPADSILLAAHVATLGFVAGTSEVLTGYECRSGPRVDVLPLRVDLGAADRWADLVADVHEARVAIASHGGSGRFETVFGAGSHAATDAVARFRAGCTVAPTGGIGLDLGCQPGAYGPEQLERIAGYYVRALRLIAADPQARCRLSELLGDEEEALLRGFSGPDLRLPAGTFAALFDRQVLAAPHRVALRCGPNRLTYAALDAESERFVAFLRDSGVSPGDVVATLLPRGVAWAVSVLALMKLGAVYLPQDLEYPAERIVSVLSRSGCRHIVTDAAAVGSVSRDLPSVGILVYEDAAAACVPPSPVTRPAQQDPAYIIFTSGSTGEPKGAVISHRGLLNHLLAKQRDLRLGEHDRIAQVATQCFDISVWQLLAAWLCGGTTTIYSRFDVLDVPAFVRALAVDAITVVEVVPSYLDLMLGEASLRQVDLSTMRVCVVTGEQLAPDLTSRWFARCPAVPLVNAYGPTEASDDVSHHYLHVPVVGGRVPVGRPIINTGIHVVGPDGTLRPLGSYGEICVTGAGVGAGYVNDEERTAAVFRPNTFDDRSATVYHTGDVGRWLPGGLLDCAGRRDDQVKVRGYRIELSDIDEALVRLPGVHAAVTLAHSSGGQTRLTAYFVGPASPDLAAFQRGLSAILPAYMHPEKVVRLERFPLAASGKVDRKALAHRDDRS